MNKARLAAALIVAVTGTSAWSKEPDFSGIIQAAEEVSRGSSSLEKDLPNIQTAHGTAQAVDRFARIEDTVRQAYVALMKEGVSYFKEHAKEPMPEKLSRVFVKMNRVKEDYPNLGPGLGRLIHQYANDPEVAAAIDRLRTIHEKLGSAMAEAREKMGTAAPGEGTR